MAGPAGCLQFFTSDTGTINTFNWETTTSFHLQNQDYSVCIRQNKDFCVICYAASIAYIATTTTNSFGLSVGSAAILADAQADTSCSTDYILIPAGLVVAGGKPATGTAPNSATVSSNKTPFRLGVFTDSIEVKGATADAMA